MADTRIQAKVEKWVREQWMPTQYGQKFHRDQVRLSPGGVYSFDAVSEDGTIIAAISTSGATTSGGKRGIGKLLKIRSDIYFLLLADTQRRLVLLTEQDMYELCEQEKANGRVPAHIEFVHVQIPADLDRELQAARRVASNEVAPNQQE